MAVDAIELEGGAGSAHRFDLDAVVIGGHEHAAACGKMSHRMKDAGARQIEQVAARAAQLDRTGKRGGRGGSSVGRSSMRVERR